MGKRLFLLFLTIALLGALAVGLLIGRGFRANAPVPRWEATIAREVRNLAIPRAERDKKNPVAATSAFLQEGRNSFLSHCAACHGIDGSGKTPVGTNLYPRFLICARRWHRISPMAKSTTSSRTASNSPACRPGAGPGQAMTSGSWFCLSEAWGCLRRRNKTSNQPSWRLHTIRVHNPAKNAIRKSMPDGKRRPWRMWCAIPASIPRL